MKKLFSLFLFLTFVISVSEAQIPQEIQIVDPPFWWTNMPINKLQLQLYGEGLGQYTASVNYPGVEISRQVPVDSPNYLFLYFDISNKAKAGEMEIVLKKGKKKIALKYSLKTRESEAGRNQGFDASDVIYLMMPDRFANSDTTNDSVPGMLEKADRNDPTKRQGGDIQGVMNHLDYIKNLGMTAIWFTPMFENDMPPEYGAYHGYAATDLYKVDRRFGSNETYKKLVDKVHANGMKVIMDMIHNHIGDRHWWMKDLPAKDWVHDFEKQGQTNFRGAVASDPYASQYDKDKLTKGWFVKEMPDLNQKNPLLADYLIQNTIWWIEFSGIDGIRMDTYVYPDKDYMARWAKEVLATYPNFNIVGEAWVNTVPHEGFWQYDNPGTDDGYNSHLPSVTDFQFSFAAHDAFTQDFGWKEGLSKLYYLFAQDAVYADPMKNVIFLDNHDMSRFYEQISKNKAYFKMAYAFLMTARGIPQVYYGTELMMGHEHRGGDDEGWRQAMPGGWPDDERSIFTKNGRTNEENEMIEYVTKLTTWRKTAPAIHHGKLVQFVPAEDIYIYFRIADEQTVMVVMNKNKEKHSISHRQLNEILQNFTSAKNILTGESIDITKDFGVAGETTGVFEMNIQ